MNIQQQGSVGNTRRLEHQYCITTTIEQNSLREGLDLVESQDKNTSDKPSNVNGQVDDEKPLGNSEGQQNSDNEDQEDASSQAISLMQQSSRSSDPSEQYWYTEAREIQDLNTIVSVEQQPLNPSVVALEWDNANINIKHPRVTWEQTPAQVILRVYLTSLKLFRVSIEDSGRLLKFDAQTQSVHSGRQESEECRGDITSAEEYAFSLKLYAQVIKYQCYQYKDCLLVELDKLIDQQIAWPQLTCEKTSSEREVSPNHKDSVDKDCDDDNSEQDGTDERDRCLNGHPVKSTITDCFEDIELYLSQLNRQLPGPVQEDEEHVSTVNRRVPKNVSTANDFDTQLKNALKKYYSTSNDSDKKLKATSSSGRIRQPRYNSEIFNPFGKASHQLKVKPKRDSSNLTNSQDRDTMKHDYRRETSSSSGGYQGSSTDSSKNTARNALDYRKTYLFLYNVLLFIMFLMVFMILVIKLISGSIDDDSVRGAAFIVKMLTYTQLLESIHPMLGLVPGGPFMPFLQVIGRIIVNHFLSDPKIRLDSAPYAHYLFTVWTCIEIFRYSFYALRVFNVEIYPITWCRYTLFMPLYPMGGFCESQVILSTIRNYGPTGKYSVQLPNVANMSFDLPMFLKFYTYVLLGPSILHLMRYMWSQRCRQLGRKEKIA